MVIDKSVISLDLNLIYKIEFIRMLISEFFGYLNEITYLEAHHKLKMNILMAGIVDGMMLLLVKLCNNNNNIIIIIIINVF